MKKLLLVLSLFLALPIIVGVSPQIDSLEQELAAKLDDLQPTYTNIVSTVYYTPLAEDFESWSTGASDNHDVRTRLGWCVIPPSQRGFFEDVKCQGSGVSENRVFQFNTIQPTRQDSVPIPPDFTRGRTSTGTDPLPKWTVAVNDQEGTPCHIPYGTLMYIYWNEGNPWNGIYRAEDTGSAFRGQCKIDVYAGVGTRARDEAIRNGLSNARPEIYILDENFNPISGLDDRMPRSEGYFETRYSTKTSYNLSLMEELNLFNQERKNCEGSYQNQKECINRFVQVEEQCLYTDDANIQGVVDSQGNLILRNSNLDVARTSTQHGFNSGDYILYANDTYINITHKYINYTLIKLIHELESCKIGASCDCVITLNGYFNELIFNQTHVAIQNVSKKYSSDINQRISVPSDNNLIFRNENGQLTYATELTLVDEEENICEIEKKYMYVCKENSHFAIEIFSDDFELPPPDISVIPSPSLPPIDMGTEFNQTSNSAESFITKTTLIAQRLNMDPMHLLAIMHFETGGQFRANTTNPVSGAVGLIQFLSPAASDLGTTLEELSQMHRLDQLDYVEAYFNMRIRSFGELDTLEKAYAAVLCPGAITHPQGIMFTADQSVDGACDLQSNPSLAYNQNRGLDRNDDGVITMEEAAQSVRNRHDMLAANINNLDQVIPSLT